MSNHFTWLKLGHPEGDTCLDITATYLCRGEVKPEFDRSEPSQDRERCLHHSGAHRLARLTNGNIPPDGLKPHQDLLKVFPYLGTPHNHPDPPPGNGG